jgi:hypothetical protein
MRDWDFREIGALALIALMVLLKLLEVVFRKITEWSFRLKERRRELQEARRAPPAPPAPLAPSRTEGPAPSGVEGPAPTERQQPQEGQEKRGPYLPYEEMVEEIFGPYIELRKKVHETRKGRAEPEPPPARPKPRQIDASIRILEELPPVAAAGPAPKRRPVVSRARPAFSIRTPEEARRAFVASLIFAPPPGLRRRR